MLSSEQVLTFLSVLDHGGFSGAAKVLNRTQSSVTYAVQKLEADLGVVLFDRSVRRLTLTPQGRALHPLARRLARDVEDMRRAAEGLARGIEPKMLLAVDMAFPEQRLLAALSGLQGSFPSVPVRIFSEAVHASAESVLNGTCMLAIIGPVADRYPELSRRFIGEVQRIPVAAPSHPLARLVDDVPMEAFGEHVQIVLSSRSSAPRRNRLRVPARAVWRINDMGLKRAALVAGLGWGRLPVHVAHPDLQAGRLVRLRPQRRDDLDWSASMPFYVAWRRDAVLGPVSTWLRDHLGEQPASIGGALSVVENASKNH